MDSLDSWMHGLSHPGNSMDCPGMLVKFFFGYLYYEHKYLE